MPADDPNLPEAHADSTPLSAGLSTGKASILRRRALLRSLGAASTVAAAGVPLKAHAYFSGKYCVHPLTGKNHHATVSGCHSVIMSLKAGNTNLVTGHNTLHYQTREKWPINCNNGYEAFTLDTAFGTVFRCGLLGDWTQSVHWWCVNRPASDEAHWITAIANAKKRDPYFAYTQKEVVDFYNNPSKYSAALNFFKEFCETEA